MRLLLLFVLSSLTSWYGALARSGRYTPPPNGIYDIRSTIDPKKLNVHLVPHTHLDTGWLMNVDEYYEKSVKKIFKSVVENLSPRYTPFDSAEKADMRRNRRFIFAESAYIARFLQAEDTDEYLIESLKDLINSDQVQIVNGGWCMHDEATNSFSEMLDQTTRGHMFLLKNFGPKSLPKIGWQIDPFGHSKTHSDLLVQQLGMDALFFGRMDHQDRDFRAKNKSLEWLWNAGPSGNENASLLTGFLFGSDGAGLYSGPFSFDDVHNYQVVDSTNMTENNVTFWMEKIVSFANFQAKSYQTNHIMWTMGSDFNYENATRWYENLDKLIHYSKLNGTINFLYSTPARYAEEKLKSLPKKSNVWSIRNDDIFPISDGPHEFWGGYFTSRVGLKRIIREGFSILTSLRQLDAFSAPSSITQSKETKINVSDTFPVVGASILDALECAVSVATHHDGTTGSSKQAVANDYAKRIDDKINFSFDQIAKTTRLFDTEHPDDIFTCMHLNITYCNRLVNLLQNEGEAIMHVWNPHSFTLKYPFQLPAKRRSEHFIEVSYMNPSIVINSEVILMSPKVEAVPLHYLNKFDMTISEVIHGYSLLRNSAGHVVKFIATLPPLNFTTIRLKYRSTYNSRSSKSFLKTPAHALQTVRKLAELDISTEPQQLISDNNWQLDDDFLPELFFEELPFKFDIGFYVASEGSDNKNATASEKQPGGAYILRSSTHSYTSLFDHCKSNRGFRIIEESIFKVLRYDFCNWVSIDITLWQSKTEFPFIELEYTVGPIPLYNSTTYPYLQGKEVVLKYMPKGQIRNHGVFYTDSNGREMIPREVNRRSKSYVKDYRITQKIGQNFYPATSWAKLCGEAKCFSVNMDTPQAVGSLVRHTAELEFLVHRRLVQDDYRGVDEALNETMCGCRYTKETPECLCDGLIITGKHWISIGSNANVSNSARLLARSLVTKPLVIFGNSLAEVNYAELDVVLNVSALPRNVVLLTLTTNYNEILQKTTSSIFQSKVGDKLNRMALIRFYHPFGANEHEELSKDAVVRMSEVWRGSDCAKISHTGFQVFDKIELFTLTSLEVISLACAW